MWDFPGHIDFFDPIFDFQSIFGDAGAIIFVIDAQDDYLESLNKLHIIVAKAYRINSVSGSAAVTVVRHHLRDAEFFAEHKIRSVHSQM